MDQSFSQSHHIIWLQGCCWCILSRNGAGLHQILQLMSTTTAHWAPALMLPSCRNVWQHSIGSSCFQTDPSRDSASQLDPWTCEHQRHARLYTTFREQGCRGAHLLASPRLNLLLFGISITCCTCMRSLPKTFSAEWNQLAESTESHATSQPTCCNIS